MSNRYEELDSLRGIASSFVVIHHCLLTFGIFHAAYSHQVVDSVLVKIITNSPLHIFWGGDEAVILFFILSGFVLSLPFLNNKPFYYPNYVIKRLCRIYIPYILTVSISGLLFTLFKDPLSISTSISEWSSEMWAHPITFYSVVSYILMLGYDTHNLNTVTWSLVHEMRISLFFPLLMIPVLKFDWKKSLIIGISIAEFFWLFFSLVSRMIDGNEISSLLNSIGGTFYYSAFFVLGAVFAKYRNSITLKLKNTSLYTKALLSFGIIILYSCEWTIPGLGSLKLANSTVVYLLINPIIDWLIAISVLGIFAFVLSNMKIQRILKNNILLFFGKISYSLYLVHPIVLLCYIYFMTDTFPLTYLWFLVPLISIVIATLTYKYIELPSITLGKKITSKQPNRSKKIA